MLPTIPQLGADEKPLHRRVPHGAALDRPVLAPARRSTQRRLKQRAARARPPAGTGISAGVPPRRIRRALPGWSCRRTYGALIRSVARSPECVALCKKHQIAVTTWAAAMTAAAIEADTSTGMCWAAYETIGAMINRRRKVVQRAFTVARALGLALEVYRGRELGREERLQLHRDSAGAGHPQRGIPSGWQLAAIPPATAARFSTPHPGRFCMWSTFDHLPLWGSFSPTSHVAITYLCTLTGTTEAATRPQPRRRPNRSDPRARALAAGMVRRVSWLAGERPDRLAPCLSRFATAATPWSAPDVVGMLENQAARAGRRFAELDRAEISRPWALLAAMLRTIDPISDYPGPAFLAHPHPIAGLPVLIDYHAPQDLLNASCEICRQRRGRDRGLAWTPIVCDTCWTDAQDHVSVDEIHHAQQQPCGHPDCDRAGTRTVPSGTLPCPDCPPQLLTDSRHHNTPALLTWDENDPPF